MGKSGIICRKIAATLTSTGTPAFFLHPAEAIHGDLGVIQRDDVVVALSYSGETDEIAAAARDDPPPRRQADRHHRRRRDRRSPQAADVALDCSVTEEACPLNLVPTASTTAALALGDALAMTLLVEKGFRQEDFANLHPGGKLGKRLMRVEALMHGGKQCPIVRRRHADARRDLRDVEQGARHDLRRRRRRARCSASSPTATCAGTWSAAARSWSLTAADVMTRGPGDDVRATTLAVEALNIMEQRKITSIVVVEDGRRAGRRRRAPARSVADGDVLNGTVTLMLVTIERGRAHQAAAVRRRRRADRRHGPAARDGSESKHVRHPGRHRHGLGAARRAEGRASCRRARRPTTAQRAAQLGITLVHQGVPSKLDAYDEILADSGC